MIRVVAPIEIQGDRKGLLVLNYLAGTILSDLRKIPRENYMKIGLLNEDGYWLLNEDPSLEWGFMLGNSEANVSSISPGIQRAFDLRKRRAFTALQGFWIFTRISPLPNSVITWIISSTIRQSYMTGILITV